MSTDLMARIVRAAGSYHAAVRDLMDAGFCFSKASRAAHAHYGYSPRT